MKIKLSQQVSATYARNNFKAVNDKAIKEGKCIILRKSKPVTVILSMEEYKKLKNKKPKKQKKKITLKQLRKKPVFKKHTGCIKKLYPDKTSVELQHQWFKYVD